MIKGSQEEQEEPRSPPGPVGEDPAVTAKGCRRSSAPSSSLSLQLGRWREHSGQRQRARGMLLMINSSSRVQEKLFPEMGRGTR